jgi:hypothetical protein
MSRRDDLVKLRNAVEVGTWPGCTEAVFSHSEHMSAFRAFNGSLDAARELHDATLPGVFWHIGHLDEGYVPTVAHEHYTDNPSWHGFNMCPARAWLIAILEALIVQEDAAREVITQGTPPTFTTST